MIKQYIESDSDKRNLALNSFKNGFSCEKYNNKNKKGNQNFNQLYSGLVNDPLDLFVLQKKC